MLVLTRDPVAARIGAVVVAALTRTRRGLVSEFCLTPDRDDVPTDCVVNFDNVHTLPRHAFRRRVTTLLNDNAQLSRAGSGCSSGGRMGRPAGDETLPRVSAGTHAGSALTFSA